MIIEGSKLIDNVVTSSLITKPTACIKLEVIIWINPVSVGLKIITKNVIITKKISENFKLFCSLIKSPLFLIFYTF